MFLTIMNGSKTTGSLRWIFLPVIFFMITTNSICQENGYIITKENEFKGGIVKFTNSKSNSVSFSDSINGKFKIYSSDELLEYGFHKGRRFISRTVTYVKKGKVFTQRLFLELLVTGKINFYRVRHETNSYYFIQKEGNRLVPLNGDPDKASETYRGAINHYMSDCEAIQDALALSRLSKPYLTTLTERYNRCDERIVPRFQVGVFAGMQLSHIMFSRNKTDITSLIEADFKLAIAPKFGIYANLPIEGGLSLQTEVGYNITTFNSLVREKTGDDIVEENAEVKMSVGDFAFSLKYSSLKPGIRPYIHGGAGLAFALSQSNKIDRYQKIDSIETTEKIDWTGEAMSDFYLKVLLGAGLNFYLSDKYPMFIEARFEGLFANSPPTPNITGIGLVVGVGF